MQRVLTALFPNGGSTCRLAGDRHARRIAAESRNVDARLGDRTRDRAILPARQIEVFERYTKGGGALGLF
jgi:hypothetical protein